MSRRPYVSCETQIEQVQYALDCLFHWSVKLNLPINFDKCCVLPVASTNPQGVYHIGGYLLRETTYERDLGVIVSPFFKTGMETQRKCAAASRILWAIRRSFANLSIDVFRRLYITYIRPILEYRRPACFLLTKREKDLLEKVQRRCTKWVKGIRDLAYEECLEKLTLYSLE